MPSTMSFRERITGKWQIPLLVTSLALLAGAFLKIKPDATDIPFDVALDHLDSLVDGGIHERAIADAHGLLAGEMRTRSEKGQIHLRLARAYGGLGEENRKTSSEWGRRVTEQYDQAVQRSAVLSAEDHERLARANESLGRLSDALEHVTKATELGAQYGSELRRHAYMIHEKLGASPDELLNRLAAFYAELEDHRLDLRLWYLEEQINVLEELGRVAEFATVLVRQADAFKDSDFSDDFAYLEALFMYKTGRFEEAENQLRTVRNRIPVDSELHAKTGWLLGRVVLDDGGPQRPYDAASFFEDVVALHKDSPYAVAGLIGLAESYTMLERHDDAIDAYASALRQIDRVGTDRLINRDVLRVSLGVMSQAQQRSGRFDAAVTYAQFAVDLADPNDQEQLAVLLQQLAQVQQKVADARTESATDPTERPDSARLADRQKAGEAYAAAAATYVALSRVHTLNERRTAESSWRAAELYALAGQATRAISIYQSFVTERPGHALIARALFRIGQLRLTLGDLPGAIDGFRNCYRLHPRVLDGARALVPLARCYLLNGEDQLEMAEKTLLIILEDSELFTPRAPEFADALFLLGELRHRRGEYESAIGTFEEALERYPDDPRVTRSSSLLADAYRQSGTALKREVAEAGSTSEIEYIRNTSQLRFDRARELYRSIISTLGAEPPGSLSALDKTILRHAYLYEADCYYEVGDYVDALDRYEDAARMYKDTPTSLAAYVQIVNCQVFLGRPDEARAVLARAQIVVDAIPDVSFSRSVSPESRDDWKRYLKWLETSGLF